MRRTSSRREFVNAWVILHFLALANAQNILGKASEECSGDDLCNLDATCLSFERLATRCEELSYTRVFEGSGPREFSAFTDNPQLYASKNFIVATYKKGNYISNECCDVTFGESCIVPAKPEQYFNMLIAVMKDGGLCYQDIEYEKKIDKTVWCWNTTVDSHCEECFPCMTVKNGQIVQEHSREFISFERDHIADYCFFTATNEQARRGQQIQSLIYDVADFSLDDSSMTVALNDSQQKCIKRTIMNLDPVKIVSELPSTATGETWCFFLKGADFSNFTSQATCLRRDGIQYSFPPDSTKVLHTIIVTVAILSLLLVIVLVLGCFYRSTIRIMFQKKEDTLNAIPKSTIDIMKTDESENLIADHKRPEDFFLPKGDKTRTSERYTTMSPGKTLDHNADNRLNDKPDEISKAIYKVKIEEEQQKAIKEFRDRMDSGMLSDVSGDVAFDVTNDVISSDQDYISKSPYHCTFPPTASTSYDTATDSGISSMTGDSGGNFSLFEEQTRSYTPRNFDRQVTSNPGKYFSPLSVLEEVISNTQDTVALEKEVGCGSTKIFSTGPVSNENQICNDGYIEKDSLSKIGDGEQFDGKIFHVSWNNNNYLKNADKFHLKLNNTSNDKLESNSNNRSLAFGKRSDPEGESGEKEQRYSASSTDTGCGSNSYDEEEYCRKCILNEEIMFPGEPVCPSYVMKSDMEFYDGEFGSRSKLPELQHSILDSCA